MKEYIKLTPERLTAIVETFLREHGDGELKSNQYIDGVFEHKENDGTIMYWFNPEEYKN